MNQILPSNARGESVFYFERRFPQVHPALRRIEGMWKEHRYFAVDLGGEGVPDDLLGNREWWIGSDVHHPLGRHGEKIYS